LFEVEERCCQGSLRGPIHGADWTIDTALILRPTSQHPALALLVREVRKHNTQSGPIWVQKKSVQPEQLTGGKKSQSKTNDRSKSLPLFEAS
jgi:hypothetical protein